MRTRTSVGLEDLLPSPDDGPDAVAIRQLMLEQIETALDELPPEQRAVFIAQELEGRELQGARRTLECHRERAVVTQALRGFVFTQAAAGRL